MFETNSTETCIERNENISKLFDVIALRQGWQAATARGHSGPEGDHLTVASSDVVTAGGRDVDD
jgi:hypothetical protein